jgi:hypothetical protein
MNDQTRVLVAKLLFSSRIELEKVAEPIYPLKKMSAKERQNRKDALIAGLVLGGGVGMGTAANTYASSAILSASANEKADRQHAMVVDMVKRGYTKAIGKSPSTIRRNFVNRRFEAILGTPIVNGKPDFWKIGAESRALIPKLTRKKNLKAAGLAGLGMAIPTALATTIGAKAFMDRE